MSLVTSREGREVFAGKPRLTLRLEGRNSRIEAQLLRCKDPIHLAGLKRCVFSRYSDAHSMKYMVFVIRQKMAPAHLLGVVLNITHYMTSQERLHLHPADVQARQSLPNHSQ